MNTIHSVLTTSPMNPLRPQPVTAIKANGTKGASAAGKSEELREAFTQFVGQTFFGQMIKAMRSTVGKPAYFYGGQGEEVFRSQLDQTLAEHLTEATAERFAEPMFEHQFPHLAAAKKSGDTHAAMSSLRQLDQLPRR